MSLSSFTKARDRLVAVAERRHSPVESCSSIIDAIALVAPHQAAAVMTTDPDTNLPAGGTVVGFDASACVPFWDNELLDPDFNKFNDLLRSDDPVGTLFDATDGELERSPRFQKLYGEYGAVDELRIALSSGPSSLAIGAFVRTCGEPFSPTEVSDVSRLVVPASSALRRSLSLTGFADADQGPVVVLLDADGHIVSRSAGADELLDDLSVESLGETFPGTIQIAAARARAQHSGGALRTRLRTRTGRWLRADVTPMEGPGQIVSVTIAPAPAADLVPILLDSYGLTPRESEIVLALCRGATTKEIAADLFLSTHTVRDHLKAIFTKADVNSRGELVARLFTNHVLEPFENSVDTLHT